MQRVWSATVAWLTAMVVCVAVATAIAAARSQTAAPATSPATAEDVDTLFAQARKLLKERSLAEAVSVFERALEAAKRLGLEPRQATALCGIGEAHWLAARFPEARQFGLRCLEVFERVANPDGIGSAHNLLANVAELSGDYPEARAQATLAIAAFTSSGNRAFRAAATLNLLRATPQSEPAETDRLLASAVEDSRATKDKSTEAGALHSWGDGLFVQGRYDDAFDKLERARSLYEELGNRAALGTVFNSLGRLYRAHGRFDEALQFQLKALELHEAAGSQFELMQSLNAVASVYAMVDRLKDAREYYERALALAEQSSSIRIQDTLRANLATLLIRQGEFARAVTVLEAVVAHGADAYPAFRQAQLSGARLKLGQPREALAAAERALELCSNVVYDCVVALRQRASARAALGDEAAARSDITGALKRVEEVRAQLVPTDFFKQGFTRTLDSLYSDAIALNVGAHADATALEVAELARSRAFLDLLATRAIEPTDASSVVRGSPGQVAGMAGLRSHVTAPPASAGDLVTSAKRLGSTFVLYWVADDTLTVWTITPDGSVRASQVNVLRSRLEALVKATIAGGPSATKIPGTNAWRELYDLLIQPIRNALPRSTGSLLTIVPHGPLVSLSFAALKDAQGRYLLEDYAIHYAPAGSLFTFTSAARVPFGRTGDMLVVVDPSLPARSRLDTPLARLPGARAEAAAIAKLVPASRTMILRDTLATESRVRTAADGKAILHFATHAVVRDDDPFGSFLALSAASSDGAESDGVLTAQDIYGWNLHADLVVLSACRSGSGHITGDGVATFSRAFIYAGTPSLVVSLWDVADEPTNRLLPSFYRAWFSGQSKARALRGAQLQLLRDLRAGKVQLQTAAGPVTLPEDPVLWAGFVLIGEPD